MPDTASLPLYVQISEMLIREINAGRLIDGERLPAERDMAATLGISVGTLRKALADLADKGMLDRIQGSGNYVRQKADAASVYAFFRLELPEGGGLPTAEILSVDRMAKPHDLPPFGISPAGHRIRRLRRLSGRPAALEEIWLDGSYAERIELEDVSESLYRYYRSMLGLWIARAEDKVGIGVMPSWPGIGFPLGPGMPCGYVERIAWAGDGSSAEYSRTWFDHQTARYVARLK